MADAEGEVVVPMFGIEEYTPSEPPEEVQPAQDANGSAVGADTTQPSPKMREDRAPGTPVHGLMRPTPGLPSDLPALPPELPGELDEPQDLPLPEPVSKKARLEADDELPDHLVPEQERLPMNDTELYTEPRGAMWGIRVQVQGQPRRSAATRKDQKALEKEIPWHMIPEDQRPGYLAALRKEWDVWLKYQVVEHFNPERILSARVCYRNKNAAYPWLPIKEKARIVRRGDQDPDLLSLRRDAPTMTRTSLMCILQIGASMPRWFLFNADITGAFLQGDQSMASRKEPLFLKQPREGLPGLAPGQLLLVVRGIFGLANSPRLFWRHLRDSLIRMGFIQSTLDRAVFMYYKHGKLVLVLGAHVDDLIGTGAPGKEGADSILHQLREIFDFGAWADSRQEKVLEYGGKQITVENDGIKLNQQKFVQAATTTSIPKWRLATPNAELFPQEMTELRSLGGCLHWLTGQSRPDLAAGTSLFMSGKPTISNLSALNKLVREAKASEDWGLRFKAIDLEAGKMVVFADSSWAIAAELKPQAGYMVFVTGQNVDTLTGDTACLLDWRSHRIKRQCRSTLASETMAMDAGVDSAIYCRELMGEILIQDYHATQSGRLPPSFLPVLVTADCRSLYDLLTKDGPLASTQEKRLAIDLVGLKETAAEIDPEQEQLKQIFKWVATDRQLADHLTKLKPAGLLRSLLDSNHVALQAAVDGRGSDPQVNGPPKRSAKKRNKGKASFRRGAQKANKTQKAKKGEGADRAAASSEDRDGLPTPAKAGTHSYTVDARVQDPKGNLCDITVDVLLRAKAYYIKKATPVGRLGQISWKKFGGPHPAWCIALEQAACGNAGKS
ncbi:Retrovirus-related Pol polyprotein from transposon RE1 (Retro element 1) (AtRE1) [Includes: Protease RE1 [Durusdinium trenchii]